MSLAQRRMMGHAVSAKLLLTALLIALAACEALPEQSGPAATPSDAQFRAIMSAAAAPDNPFLEDRNLTAILARREITLDQRLQVLAMRAAGRSRSTHRR